MYKIKIHTLLAATTSQILVSNQRNDGEPGETRQMPNFLATVQCVNVTAVLYRVSRVSQVMTLPGPRRADEGGAPGQVRRHTFKWKYSFALVYLW